MKISTSFVRPQPRASRWLSVLVSLVLLLGLPACKHRPVAETNIPGSQPSGGPAPNPNPSPGLGVPSTENPSSTPGIPETESKWSRIWNSSHDEDRDKFKADAVYFDFDSSIIKPEEQAKLQDVANYFKTDSTNALQVEGNCDERGTEKYNLSLGERRAQAVREYLANLGMDAQRIHTLTYGASRPVDPGHNEEAWKKNRRGDIVLLIPR